MHIVQVEEEVSCQVPYPKHLEVERRRRVADIQEEEVHRKDNSRVKEVAAAAEASSYSRHSLCYEGKHRNHDILWGAKADAYTRAQEADNHTHSGCREEDSVHNHLGRADSLGMEDSREKRFGR